MVSMRSGRSTRSGGNRQERISIQTRYLEESRLGGVDINLGFGFTIRVVYWLERNNQLSGWEAGLYRNEVMVHQITDINVTDEFSISSNWIHTTIEREANRPNQDAE
jgi:hypothetical protein